jgi:chromosome segregation ATPase
MGQARLEEKAQREQALNQKQTDFAAARRTLESVEAAVTQSRIRNAALGEKRDNTHVNLANRIVLQEQTASEIATRKQRLADCQQQRGEIEQALAQTEQALGQSRLELQDLEARLQSERQRYRTISMQLAEIGEVIKELRPLSEACQEEKNHLHLTLAEQRLHL